jgi:hypothetical protein
VVDCSAGVARSPLPCPDIAEIAAAWPDLPDYIRAAVLAMVRGANVE